MKKENVLEVEVEKTQREKNVEWFKQFASEYNIEVISYKEDDNGVFANLEKCPFCGNDDSSGHAVKMWDNGDYTNFYYICHHQNHCQVNKLGYKSAGDYTVLCDHPNAQKCLELAQEIATLFRAGEVDKVELIYHHFKSAGSQILTRRQFLPIDIQNVDFTEEKGRDLTTTIATRESQEYMRLNHQEKVIEDVKARPLNSNYIVEPDIVSVLSKLIPQYLNLKVYTALLDSNASEHAARMVAMQTATDNADELLRQLNLQYNKSRQQAITNELLDLAGGSQN
ncbi:MAG: F0F1 ATP synthase subunit gamma [Bacteroidales bacterium]|nr:F0F1 ATP synthase subunit gamma [Bacteroidales bacterium]